MRRIQLLFVAAAFFILAVPGLAETPPETPEIAPGDAVAPQDAPVTPSDSADELTWEQFDDPEFDATAANAEMLPAAAPEPLGMDSGAGAETSIGGGIALSDAEAFETSGGVVLGPEGVDDQGRRGRLHTVSSGDTLWDLSAAYLGTAWVWPSVWIDNDDIANPHLIMPGDKIWITANEMRVVTDAEAESYLDPGNLEPEIAASDSMPVLEEMPMEEPIEPVAALETSADDPSTLEAFPVAVPGQDTESATSGRQITISRRDAMGFVSEEDLAGASSIVDSPTERTFLAQGDPVILGMGEGDVEIGDQFTIFQVVEEVRDVETNRVLGHHVDILGWLEVRELTGDTSIGEIRTSYAEMRRGVRVMARPMAPRRVTARSTPDAIEGKVVFLPSERTVMADGGYVYLNRGEFHGVEVGSELEVFDSGGIVNDRSRRVDVRTPDHSVAKLVVVSVMEHSSVAFVLSSSRELEVGDDVRPRIARVAAR